MDVVGKPALRVIEEEPVLLGAEAEGRHGIGGIAQRLRGKQDQIRLSRLQGHIGQEVFLFVVAAVRQAPAGQGNRRIGGVFQLRPIGVFADGLGQIAVVGGHGLVDDQSAVGPGLPQSLSPLVGVGIAGCRRVGDGEAPVVVAKKSAVCAQGGKLHLIRRQTDGRHQAQALAAGGEGKAGVQLRTGAVLSVAEDQQVFSRLQRHGRERPFLRLRRIVGQIPAGQIHRRAATVVKLGPVSEIAITVAQAAAVVRHDLAEHQTAVIQTEGGDVPGVAAVVIGIAGSRTGLDLPGLLCSAYIGFVLAQRRKLHPVEQLSAGALQANDLSAITGKAEVGSRFSAAPDHIIAVRRQYQVIRQGKFCLAVRIGQAAAGEGHRIGAGVVQFNEIIIAAVGSGIETIGGDNLAQLHGEAVGAAAVPVCLVARCVVGKAGSCKAAQAPAAGAEHHGLVALHGDSVGRIHHHIFGVHQVEHLAAVAGDGKTGEIRPVRGAGVAPDDIISARGQHGAAGNGVFYRPVIVRQMIAGNVDGGVGAIVQLHPIIILTVRAGIRAVGAHNLRHMDGKATAFVVTFQSVRKKKRRCQANCQHDHSSRQQQNFLFSYVSQDDPSLCVIFLHYTSFSQTLQLKNFSNNVNYLLTLLFYCRRIFV